MTDLGATIAPKSDQLNADDLIAGPMTITVTAVRANPSAPEQPISIFFDGDNGKPYKPCKSMRRVLVQLWGRDGGKYVGGRLTLYRDPAVKFGGIEVGGIRISHMSGIDGDRTMALTATRASRKPYTVKPLSESRAMGSSAPPSPRRDRGATGETSPAGADTQPTSPDPLLPPTEEVSEDTGASDHASDAPVFTFTLIDRTGAARTTVDAEAWATALIGMIAKKPFDAAKRAWVDNEAHVRAAGEAGYIDPAARVEQAWRERERGSADTGRAG